MTLLYAFWKIIIAFEYCQIILLLAYFTVLQNFYDITITFYIIKYRFPSNNPD